MEENVETPRPAEDSGGGSEAEQDVNVEKGEYVQPGEVSPEVSKDARTWAMLCHLLAIFTGFIAPLIIWLVKKEEDPFVNEHGKEALNFQITVAIAMLASGLLSFVCIGIPLAIAVGIANLVFCIIASIRANNGEAYRYPVAIRFIK
jgi:uncharacterized Tic20 family protein